MHRFAFDPNPAKSRLAVVAKEVVMVAGQEYNARAVL